MTTSSSWEYTESDGDDKFFVFVILAVIIIVIFGAWHSSTRPQHKGYWTQDEACKGFYGQEYKYVSGYKSPDMCATVNGEARYYSLIPDKE
jgi:hypothetical protein